jgi:hypothetical protein
VRINCDQRQHLVGQAVALCKRFLEINEPLSSFRLLDPFLKLYLKVQREIRRLPGNSRSGRGP